MIQSGKQEVANAFETPGINEAYGTNEALEDIRIDRARAGDGEDLARLASQLGYTVDSATVECAIERLGRHSPSDAGDADETEAIIVARNGIGRPVGWTSVSVVSHFYTPTVAEISGFVVEESLRGRGIGTAMMDEVLRWAHAAGCPGLRLRANTVRVGAHRFYERLGFSRTKQQIVFVRNTGS